MQDWFKARNNWGAGIETLSDEEAGQFVKALWAYTMRGEEQELSGSAKALYAIAIMILKQDEQTTAEISQKRAAAGAIGGKQTQANASKAKEDEAKQANACNKNKIKEEEKDKEKDKEKDIKTSSLADDRFEQFWQAYPRKVGKGNARQAWQKIKMTDDLFNSILNAVEQQKQWEQWQRDNGQFIPHPATWLNQQRWEDLGIIVPKKKSKYANVKIN